MIIDQPPVADAQQRILHLPPESKCSAAYRITSNTRAVHRHEHMNRPQSPQKKLI